MDGSEQTLATVALKRLCWPIDSPFDLQVGVLGQPISKASPTLLKITESTTMDRREIKINLHDEKDVTITINNLTNNHPWAARLKFPNVQ